jgi:hypothetical protein
MNDISQLDSICENSFGLWINGFFGTIKGHYPDITFEEHKEAFFWLIEKLLSEGKIAFKKDVSIAGTFKSGDKSEAQRALEETYLWHAPPAEIAAYFRKIFPKHVTSETDVDLIFFWFTDSPYIVWKGHDGRWYGS